MITLLEYANIEILDAISFARHVAVTDRPLSDNPYSVGTADYHRFRLMWLWYRSFLNIKEVEHRLPRPEWIHVTVKSTMETIEFTVPL